MNPHTKFEAEVYVLSKDEGGRHTPFFKGYRPQFYFRTTDVTGAVELPDGVEMVMPGDNINFVAELIAPIAMEEACVLRSERVVERSVPASSPKSSTTSLAVCGPLTISRTAYLGCSASSSLVIKPFRCDQTTNESSGRPVAQLAEQRIPNPQVGGSIPSWPATFARDGAGG